MCRGHPGADGVRVESVDPLERLPGGAVDRDEAYRSIVGKILEAPRSVWGFDFAFGLPTAEGWEGLSGRNWPQLVAEISLLDGPEALETSGLLDSSATRATDPAGRNWSEHAVLEGAFYGITRIVAPLLSRVGVAILPMESLPLLPAGMSPEMVASAPSIYLLEVCSKRLIMALDQVERQPETGEFDDLGNLYRRLVAARWLRPLARSLREPITAGGGALAATLAAVAAWRGYRESDHGALHRDQHYKLEGYAYP